MFDDAKQEELRSLINARWDGTFTEEQLARLEELTCEDEDACHFYLDYMELHGLLVLEHMQDHSNDCLVTLLDEMDEECEWQAGGDKKSSSPVLQVLGDVFQAGADLLSRPAVLTLLLAIGLPGILLLILGVNVMRQSAPLVPVAQITRANNCVWSDVVAGAPTGTNVFVGKQLRLDSGLLELTFTDGATVLLEGPCRFEANGPAEGFLHTGRLVAKVIPKAKGFAVRAPSATIIDLGTEFGLAVAKDGTTEAHVFQGEVEVVTRPAVKNVLPSTKRLHAGQAAQVIAAAPGKEPQIVPMAAAEKKFVRQLYEDLPQPTILFAHRGSTDPVREGWALRHDNRFRIEKGSIELGPVDEGGVPAWSIRTEKENQIAYYAIDKGNGLTPELLTEANQKGWVLRARIWMSEKSQIPPEKWRGIAAFSYRNGDHVWTVRPSVDADGNQCFFFLERNPHGAPELFPIPKSRNQYVDYELRCNPVEDFVDLFVNGRRVSRQSIKVASEKPDAKGSPLIRFGGWRPVIDARFALVEWGILRDSPAAAKQ